VKKFAIIVLLLVAAGFAWGLNQLFKLRFETGDVYPPYSSFRSDPLGTKALYESFDHLLSVERNFRPFPKLETGRDTALFVLGLEPKGLRLPEGELKEMEHYVVSGGRVVFSFHPIFLATELSNKLPFPPKTPPPPKPANKRAKQRQSPANIEEQDEGISLSEHWKFGLNFAALEREKDQPYKPVRVLNQTDNELPESISCHTALYFDKLNPAWRVLYARTNDQAVLVERKLGSGSIVLAADSYCFSNEALLKERYPNLLAWLSGSARTAIFDETHLGVQENRGVAALARKYRLHGFAAGLLGLAGLFAWRFGSSLIPPYEEEVRREQGELVTGKESAVGFTNLLRRNISSRELLKICLEEWNKSCRHRVPVPRLQKIQAVIDSQNALPERQRDPVATYRQITEALARTPALPARNNPNSR
jgi:hypothetical protein